MPEGRDLYGLLAEFASADSLVKAARSTRDEGYSQLDAFTPFPVEELNDVLGLQDKRIGPIFFVGGVAGLALALAVMVYVNIDYPLNVGGRPLFAWPAFLVVGVELMILASVIAGVVAMLFFNGLPRLHHPVFESSRFSFASDNRFFLCVLARDQQFDEERTRAFLTGLDPRSIELVRA